jgi:hypothetical protein
MKRSAFLSLVLSLVALIGCARGSAGGDPTSGIQGRVTIGPTCPVERPDSPCPDAGYAATIRVMSGNDVVATGRSADDGSFRIPVAPGTYEIQADPLSGDGIAHAAAVTDVVVRDGAFTHVDVSFDSGIR